MSASSHRYGPAITMVAAILLAAVLAVLAPFHMRGSWNDGSSDPWQRIEPVLLTDTVQDAGGATHSIEPDTLVMLEETSNGGFAYAAETDAGGIFLGIAEDGVRLYTVENSEETYAYVAGGIGGEEAATPTAGGLHAAAETEGPRFFSLKVWRTGSDEQPFGHELREFATEGDLDAYLSANGLD